MAGRVLYVTLQAQGEWQGAATHARAVVENLRDQGWDVTIVAPRHTSVEVSLPARVLGLLTTQVRALRHLRGADVVYARHHPLMWLVGSACRLRRVPRVEELNGTITDVVDAHPVVRPFAWMLTRSSQALMGSAAAVIAVSDELAAEVPNPRTITVPNGVDLTQFSPGSGPADPPRVVFVGALTPWQGLDTLLEARRRPTWPASAELVIAGDGPLRDGLEADGGAKVLGAVPHADVPALLRQAVVTVVPKLPSAKGASPLKLYESLACGVPVVVSDVPPQSTLVREWDCGIVVPPGDADALASAIAALVADRVERDRLARNGVVAIDEGQSWAARVRQIGVLLAEVIEGVG